MHVYIHIQEETRLLTLLDSPFSLHSYFLPSLSITSLPPPFLPLPGNYQQALQYYKTIHQRFPDSVDCLKFLVRLCSDLGLKEAQDYALLLKKAEKALENKKQVHKLGTIIIKSVLMSELVSQSTVY